MGEKGKAYRSNEPKGGKVLDSVKKNGVSKNLAVSKFYESNPATSRTGSLISGYYGTEAKRVNDKKNSALIVDKIIGNMKNVGSNGPNGTGLINAAQKTAPNYALHKRNHTALNGKTNFDKLVTPVKQSQDNFVNMTNDKIGKFNKFEKYLQTEPLQKSKPNKSEDALTKCFNNSLKILEKIQNNFQLSARNNLKDDIQKNKNLDVNDKIKPITSKYQSNNRVLNSGGNLTAMKQTDLKFTDNHRDRNIFTREDITANVNNTYSNLDLDKLEYNDNLRSLDLNFNRIDNYKCYQTVNVSENEKEFITRKLQENSNDRIKNYSSLFSLINKTLEEIKDSVKNINLTEENFGNFRRSKFDLDLVPRNERIEESIEYNHEANRSNLSFLSNEENDKESESKHMVKSTTEKKSCSSKSNKSKESCNFSETSMLENAIITPPKIENRCSLLSYEKILNFFKEDEYNDVTVVEFESLLDIDTRTDEERVSMLEKEKK